MSRESEKQSRTGSKTGPEQWLKRPSPKSRVPSHRQTRPRSVNRCFFPSVRHHSIWRSGGAHSHDGRRACSSPQVALTREIPRPAWRKQSHAGPQLQRISHPHRLSPWRLAWSFSGGNLFHCSGGVHSRSARMGLRALRQAVAPPCVIRNLTIVPVMERSGGCHKTTKQAEITGQCYELLFRFQVSYLNSSSQKVAGCATATCKATRKGIKSTH